jgi:hypothetical protein
MPAINIMGSFQDPNNFDQGGAKLVNVRAVPREAKEGQPAAVRLVGAPGLTTICHPTSAPCLAIQHAQETVWSAHADGTVYSGVETDTPTLRGEVLVDPFQPIVRLAEDRTALCLASNRNSLTPGGTGYIATLAGGVQNCGFDASINFDPTTVAELDNITVWSGASNFYASQDAKMYSSQPLDPANVLSNSFATKEARADRVVDLEISGLIMWPMGSRSLEQWYNPGGQTDFAFTAYPNSLVSVGLAARLSKAVLRDLIVFVGTDRRVWRAVGQSANPVSPAWVDLLLQQLTLTQLSFLTAYAYGQGGSDFYVLTMPGQWSVELAASTGIWSYRQSNGRLDHAGRCATEHDGGATFVGLDTGEICYVNANDATEPAGTLSRTMITPWAGGSPGSLLSAATNGQENRQTYDTLDVTSAMGPQAGNFTLDWSETTDVSVDGVLVSPRTWRGERVLQMPQPGVRRAIARNMGTGRRRQFRLQYSGTQAPFSMDELFLNVTGGS